MWQQGCVYQENCTLNLSLRTFPLQKVFKKITMDFLVLALSLLFSPQTRTYTHLSKKQFKIYVYAVDPNFVQQTRGYSLGYRSRNGPSGRVASPRPGRLLPRLGKRRRRPGPGARSSPSLQAAGPRTSLPDGLSPPLEQVAAVGHQTEHPRSLLPPPPIRATGGEGPRAPRPGSGAPRRQAPLGQTGQENRPGGR